MKRYFHKVAIGCFVVLVFSAFDYPNSKKIIDSYINSYMTIAISEMRRTGIPASIKLAQGILESDFGRSPLATNARNHFGIKCGGDWSGDTYYLLDDDTDSSGSLIESCFRSFSQAEDSYIAHSEFISNPSKKSRYGFLFDLSTTDYVGWANGLKFAGYATDPAYPQKLISIIEKYQLFKYDELVVLPESGILAEKYEGTNSKVFDSKDDNTRERRNGKAKNDNIVRSKNKVTTINGLRAVYASDGENIQRIAISTGKNVSELLEYNEEIKSMDYILSDNEIVYLERKKKNIEGESLYHTMQNGETMYSISQQYGIRLESLLTKNNLTPDALPLEGQQISLVKQLSKSKTPRFRLIEKFDSYVDLGQY